MNFATLISKFQASSKRERAAVLLLGVLTLTMGADYLVITPALDGIKADRAEEIVLNAEMRQLSVDLAQIKDDLNDTNLLSQLKAKQQEYDEAVLPMVQAARQKLLAPEQVVPFLRDMFPSGGRTRLISLKSDSPQPDMKLVGLYRHGFVVEMEGPYLDFVAHMRRLEASPWRLSMRSMTISTEDRTAPSVRMTLRLDAYSDAPNWLAAPQKATP